MWMGSPGGIATTPSSSVGAVPVAAVAGAPAVAEAPGPGLEVPLQAPTTRITVANVAPNNEARFLDGLIYSSSDASAFVACPPGKFVGRMAGDAGLLRDAKPRGIAPPWYRRCDGVL
jgi:hypothetical protein